MYVCVYIYICVYVHTHTGVSVISVCTLVVISIVPTFLIAVFVSKCLLYRFDRDMDLGGFMLKTNGTS